MITLLLAIIYAAFISLGLPDALLGAAWPIMHAQMNVPLSYAGIVTFTIAMGTVVSALLSDRLTLKLGAGRVTALSVSLTALALLLVLLFRRKKNRENKRKDEILGYNPFLSFETKSINEHGEEEFQRVCMDITERYRAHKTNESKRYLQALADVYEKIFEFNLDTNTVKCLHCEEASYFKRFENIAMQIDDALETWIVASVNEGQQDAVEQEDHHGTHALHEDGGDADVVDGLYSGAVETHPAQTQVDLGVLFQVQQEFQFFSYRLFCVLLLQLY